MKLVTQNNPKIRLVFIYNECNSIEKIMAGENECHTFTKNPKGDKYHMFRKKS